MMKETQKQTSKISNYTTYEANQGQRQNQLAQQNNNNPVAVAHRSFIADIDQSPRMVAQRARIESYSQTPQQSVAKSNSEGLPNNLKSGIESLSGLSMDEVKVHYNSSQPAQLNALAYAQGTDIYVAPRQEKHLPHEAWHVVQQAQGRVKPSMQIKAGVAVNNDQKLEHEADVMGTKAATLSRIIPSEADLKAPTSLDSQAIQRLAIIPTGAINYPVKKQEKFWKDEIITNNEDFFVSQVEINNSYFNSESLDDLQANLVHKSNADLMVSDTLDLAIESSVESKFFFATKTKIDEANQRLTGYVRLEKTSKYLLINSQGVSKKLYQVRAVVPKNKRSNGKTGKGLDMKVPQRCNEMADFVGGKQGVDFIAGSLVYKLLADVLTEMTDTDYAGEFAEIKTKIGSVEGNTAYISITEEMEEIFKELDTVENRERINQLMQQHRINEYMAPNIGDVITTYSVGTNEERKAADKNTTFGYHFGSVVAKSGSDYITLENYARRDNVVGVSTASGGDPLFFFKMYGDHESAKSWHEQSLASNAFVGRAISFIVSS